ncbi:MAG: hypothetical protein ACYSUV_02485 [Planctomycetota bacterium]|jgi:hypothetical protein
MAKNDNVFGMSAQDILGQYQAQYEEAKAANLATLAEGKSLLQQGIERYSPGGTFGKGAMAQYEKGKKQALGMGFQQLIDQGLGGTTIGTALPLSYEQNVGTEFRLKLEDLRMENLTDAEKSYVDFIESATHAYPDFGQYAQLAMAAAAKPTGGGTTYGGSPFPSDQPGYSGIMNEYGRGGGGASYRSPTQTVSGGSYFTPKQESLKEPVSAWNTFGPLPSDTPIDWETPPTMSVGAPTLADYGKAHQYGSSVMTLGAQQGPATQQQTADYFSNFTGGDWKRTPEQQTYLF